MSTQKIGAWVGRDAKDASEGKLEFAQVDSKKWEETDVDGESPPGAASARASARSRAARIATTPHTRTRR